MVDGVSEEAKRLRTTLRWLESHEKRLGIQQRSLRDQLEEVEIAIERLQKEIAQAQKRLEEIEWGPSER